MGVAYKYKLTVMHEAERYHIEVDGGNDLYRITVQDAEDHLTVNPVPVEDAGYEVHILLGSYIKGDPGEGVPAGGSAGQVLAKKSDDDFDAEWVDPPSGGGQDEVRYTPQELTPEQQAQARTNIGAYRKPDVGIPQSDFTKAVQTTLSKAAALESGSTEYWDSRTGYIPPAGTIIIYTDQDTSGDNPVPGIKIGSGNAYVQDLAFIGDDIAAALLAHINDATKHVTAAERLAWNHKIDIDESTGEVDNETLKITR